MISRLDQVCRLKLAQKITGADEAHPFVNDCPPPRDVRILEEQKRFDLRIAAEKALQNLKRCLFAKRANGPALLDSPLLVDTDLNRDDSDLVEAIVYPLDDAAGTRGAANRVAST